MQTKIPAAPYREQIAFCYKGKWIMIYKETKGCLLWKHYGANKHNVGEEYRLLILYLIEHVVTTRLKMVFFFPLAKQPLLGQSLLIHEVSRSHTTTHHSR